MFGLAIISVLLLLVFTAFFGSCLETNNGGGAILSILGLGVSLACFLISTDYISTSWAYNRVICYPQEMKIVKFNTDGIICANSDESALIPYPEPE